MNLKEKIKQLRLEKEETQYTISKNLNIERYTYANWEQGRSEPSLNEIINLANYFNVSTDYLLGRTENYEEIKSNNNLTYREKKLLQNFQFLDDDEKDKIIEDCEYFANKHGITKRKRNS